MRRVPALLLALCLLGPAAAADAAALTGVRSLSASNYTRVIVQLTGTAAYKVVKLTPVAGNRWHRIYIDLAGVRLRTRQRRINVNDRLVHRVRISQFRADVARVVLDLKKPGCYDAALLDNPHRILLDVERATPGCGGKRLPVRTIVLDPGHGGKDPGAVGAGGLREKDVVLRLARKLAPKLRREMGTDVVLTRTRDVFVSLKQRAAIANASVSADAKDDDAANKVLFLSIHANASRNRRAGGLETYFLGNATTETARKLAARENGIPRRNVGDLQFMLADLQLRAFTEDDSRLAKELQSSLLRNARAHYPRVRDLGTKTAPFYVLVGAHMPAALVELLFVSNRREARELQRPAMQNALVEGLALGIRRYADARRRRATR